MNFDFSYSPPRRDCGSLKWDLMKLEDPTVPADIVPLSAAEMEFPLCPAVRESMIACVTEETPGYSWPYRKYLESVTGWMKNRHGWEIEPEAVIPINGVVAAVNAALDALCEEECGVIIMTPVYYPFYDSSSRGKRHTVKCPLIETNGYYTIDFALFEKLCEVPENKVFLMCSPHNPVGRVWRKEELRIIAYICLKHDVFVISDEIHFDLVMQGYQHTVFPLAAPEMAEKCLVCTAPSKSFNIAGLETSNIIIQNKALFEKIKRNHCGLPSFLGYRACIGAYENGVEWLDECLKVINENEKTVHAFLKEKLPMITATPLEGTYLMWLDLRNCGLSREEIAKKLKTHHLHLDEGKLFGEGYELFLRIVIAVPPAVLSAALNRLDEALHNSI